MITRRQNAIIFNESQGDSKLNLSKNEILMLLKQNGVFDALSNDPTALIISFDDDKKTLLSVLKMLVSKKPITRASIIETRKERETLNSE